MFVCFVSVGLFACLSFSRHVFVCSFVLLVSLTVCRFVGLLVCCLVAGSFVFVPTRVVRKAIKAQLQQMQELVCCLCFYMFGCQHIP